MNMEIATVHLRPTTYMDLLIAHEQALDMADYEGAVQIERELDRLEKEAGV